MSSSTIPILASLFDTLSPFGGWTHRARLVAAVLLVAGALSACGSDESSRSTDSVAPAAPISVASTSSSTTAVGTTGPSSADPTSATGPTVASTTAPATVGLGWADRIDGLGEPPRDVVDGWSSVVGDLAASLSVTASVHAAVVDLDRGWSWSMSSDPTVAPADAPIRAASVGKVLTAATVFRLIESGRLSLDQPIADIIRPVTAALLRGDGYDLDAIRVRHLLSHTSGLIDFTFGDGSPVLSRLLSEPSYRWTRAEQVQLAVEIGSPIGPPGTVFHYSDTGYIVLGEIIEQVTDEPLAVAIRSLLRLDELGLDSMWLETAEPVRSRVAMAPTFLGDADLSAVDFSVDAFGGGGYAGPVDQFASLLLALADGLVLTEASWAAMTTIDPVAFGQSTSGVELGDGAHGLYRVDVNGQSCWSHRGFLGTAALVCPELRRAVVVTTNVALTDPLPTAKALMA
jgi:D-alanyl-D-alanine carboxypeptidase